MVPRLTCLFLVTIVWACSVFSSAAAEARATFVRIDSTTQGDWIGRYGREGFRVVGSGNKYPDWLKLSPRGDFRSWVADNVTSDKRALLKSSGQERVAGSWSGDPLTLDLNFEDGQPHAFALYCLDLDTNSDKPVEVQVMDAESGQVLDSRRITQTTQGRYLVWNLQGHLLIRESSYPGAGGGVAGVFIDPPETAVAGNRFVELDKDTQGNWKGKYGRLGYHVFNDPPHYPDGVSLEPEGKENFVWEESTIDPRALVHGENGLRSAGCWYYWGGGQFSLTLSLPLNQRQRVSVYCVDWDNRNRVQLIELYDQNNQLIDRRALTDFRDGLYLTWELEGTVRMVFHHRGGDNAVVSGIFFDGAPGVAAPSKPGTGETPAQEEDGKSTRPRLQDQRHSPKRLLRG